MIVVDSHVAHLSVEILALRGWLSIPAGLTPLHKTLSPTSGGIFVLMFVSGLKQLDVQCSTSSDVNGIGGGINGSDLWTSPPLEP